MVSIKYKVDDEDLGQTAAGEQPKPGVYEAELQEINVRDDRGPGKSDLECIYSILDPETGKPDRKYSRLWDYVGYESETTAWKLAQFLEAMGEVDNDNTEGEFDPEDHARKVNGKDTDLTQGTLVKVRIKADSYQGEYKGKIAAVLRHPSNTGEQSSENDPFA